MEDQEALKTCAVVSKLADTIEDKVDDFLSNGVVTASIVVGSIFLAGDNLLRMVELAISSSANFIADTRLKIDKDSTRNVLASTSLGEKGVEGVIATTDSFVRRHLTIRLDSMLQAVQFPACIAGLDTSLTQVKRENFAHFNLKKVEKVLEKY